MQVVKTIARKITLVAALLSASAIVAHAQGIQTIRIGLEPSYPPYVITNPDGSVSGLEADLMKEICSRLKAKCIWSSMDFSGLLPALVTGKIDIIPENLLQTPERAAKALMTREVIFNPTILVVPKSWTGGFENADLTGKRIGVYKASGQYKMLTEGVKVAIPVPYDGIDQESMDLRAGRLDAILEGRLVVGEKFLKGADAADWKVSDRTFFVPGLEGKGSVWVVRKDFPELLSAVNASLTAMIADCTYTKITTRYTTVQMLPDEPAACR